MKCDGLIGEYMFWTSWSFLGWVAFLRFLGWVAFLRFLGWVAFLRCHYRCLHSLVWFLHLFLKQNETGMAMDVCMVQPGACTEAILNCILIDCLSNNCCLTIILSIRGKTVILLNHIGMSESTVWLP